MRAITSSPARASERNCGRGQTAQTPDEALADYGWRRAVAAARVAGAPDIESAESRAEAAVDAMARYGRPPPRRTRDREALARRRFLVLRDVGTGALVIANRQGGQTLKQAAGFVSALYGLVISPTTARERSLRWIDLQRRLGVTPPRMWSSREILRVDRAATERDRAEAALAATRRKLADKAARAGIAAADIPQVVTAAMRGDPAPAGQSHGAQVVAAERQGKLLEAQASVQALMPPMSDIVVDELELRHLGKGWREYACTARSDRQGVPRSHGRSL